MKPRSGHPEDWSPYLDRQTTDNRYAALDGHLEECAECRAEISRLESIDNLFRKPELELEVPAFQWTRIQAAIAERENVRPRGFLELLRRGRTAWAGALTSLLLVAAVGSLVLHRRVEDARRLAQVASYAETARLDPAMSENPFRPYVRRETGNPFSRYQAPGDENPFTMSR